MDEYLIVIYKEVGKDPEFKKIKNDIQEIESILGGKIEQINFKNEFIIFSKKNSSDLKPNIYISEHLKLGMVIRGTVLIVGLENNNFKSLTKEQAIKYREFLIKESFDYTNFDDEGKYIGNKRKNWQNYLNTVRRRGEQILDKGTREYSNTKIKVCKDNINIDRTLEMILNIQSSILKFINSFSK